MRSRYIAPEVLRTIVERMPFVTGGVFLLCEETGLRVSDAVRVRGTDIDDENYLHYTAKKTGKKGRAKLSGYFILHYVPAKRTDEYLFPGYRKYTGKPVTRQTVYNHVKKACKELGIEPDGVSPHTARKTFAVDLFNREGLGATMHALQHRDAATTMLYALSDNPTPDLRRKIELLEQKCMILSSEIEFLFDHIFGADRYAPTAKGKSKK